MDEEDYRIEMGQWLRGLTVRKKRYTRWSETWDHDHCVLCWATFTDEHDYDGDDVLHEGYAVQAHVFNGNTFPDDYEWLCERCFHDMQGTLGILLASDDGEGSGK